jgi:transposase
MFGIDMKYTVKTLLLKGKSQRAISKELGISRKTVKKYFDEFQKIDIVSTPKIHKNKILDTLYDDIQNWILQGVTGVLIHEKLLKEKDIMVSYPTVSRFIKQFKIPVVYIPLIAKPGEEAQVDFGYLGKFIKDGKSVKVWCFSMVLSNSRYSYNCNVTDQSVSSFINCHIHAFEYFGGVPQTIKIDNLKAGVITPNFYEATIQRQYAEFLQYYNSYPITARIRRGQDKGKVEAGVKYVKMNFLKRIEHSDFYQLQNDLLQWTNEICNKRLHGTTKKIPAQVFNNIEKQKLIPLPAKRYEILKIEQRKVNNYAHISFKNNFYSVPYQYIEKTVIIKFTDVLLKVYDDNQEIAVHPICEKQGEFITCEEHKPPLKQRKSEQEYIQKAIDSGTYYYNFLIKLKEQKPFNWQRIIQGIFNLQQAYSIEIVNMACKRALLYNAFSYTSVRNICKNNIYDKPLESLSVNNVSGFAHNLKQYDNLIKF